MTLTYDTTLVDLNVVGLVSGHHQIIFPNNSDIFHQTFFI